MIKKEILNGTAEKYKLTIEGIDRDFNILIGGADLYFCLSDYEKGAIVTIPNNDTDTYEKFNNLLSKIECVDDKSAPLFKDGVFEWISDSGIPEECNRLKIYHESDCIIFHFWRNDIKPYRDCNISFCTCGAINQRVVNELMYFFNSYIEEPEDIHKQITFKK